MSGQTLGQYVTVRRNNRHKVPTWRVLLVTAGIVATRPAEVESETLAEVTDEARAWRIAATEAEAFGAALDAKPGSGPVPADVAEAELHAAAEALAAGGDFAAGLPVERFGQKVGRGERLPA